MRYRLNVKPKKVIFALQSGEEGLCRRMALKNAKVHWHPIRRCMQARISCPFNRKRRTQVEINEQILVNPAVLTYEVTTNMWEKMCCACDDRLLYNTEKIYGGARRAGMKYALKKPERKKPMTAGELQKTDDNTYVWVEVRNKGCREMRSEWAKRGKMTMRLVEPFMGETEIYLWMSSYGALWRCWRNKPTQAEMERERWEN